MGVTAIHHYTCDRCGFHRDLAYLPRVYSLGRGRFVPMEQRHIWCSTCNDISVCESLVRMESDVEFSRKHLQELRELLEKSPADLRSLPLHDRVEFECAPQAIREIEERESDWQEWRSRRQADVRCLKCLTAVEHVPARNDESLGHSGCGGTIQSGITIESAIERAATHPHVYDIDGALLEQGRRPTFPHGASSPEYVSMELFCSDLHELVAARRAYEASLR